MAVAPVQMADLAVRIVHEYERLGIERALVHVAVHLPKLVCQRSYSAVPAHVYSARDDTSDRPSVHGKVAAVSRAPRCRSGLGTALAAAAMGYTVAAAIAVRVGRTAGVRQRRTLPPA